MDTPEFASFEEFFPFYLGEHSDPLNRTLHYIGTASAIGLATWSLTVGPVWLLAFLLPVGYGPAWIGHFIIEKNRPATFKHPLWSLRGDFRMLRLFLTGQLSDKLAQLQTDA